MSSKCVMCKENDNLKAECSFSWSVSFLPAFKSVLGLCNTHRMESLLTYLLCKDTNFPTDFSYIRRSLGIKPYLSLFFFPLPSSPLFGRTCKANCFNDLAHFVYILWKKAGVQNDVFPGTVLQKRVPVSPGFV